MALWVSSVAIFILLISTEMAVISVPLDYTNYNTSRESSTDESTKSGDIIGQNLSHIHSKSCRIVVPEEAVVKFASVLSQPEGAVYVRLFVKFANVSRDMDNDDDDNIGDIIIYGVNSRTLVWALDGNGKLLLSYPGDFVFFSLGTLSPGVYDEEISITANGPSNDCYWKALDAVKELILTTFVIDMARAANASLSTNEDLYAGLGFHVCVNKLSDFMQTRDLSRLFFNLHYEYMCLEVDSSSIPSELRPIPKLSWLYLLRYIGYFLAFFSPLIGLFFTGEKPPLVRIPQSRNQNLRTESKGSLRDDVHETYYAINSDLPVGLKYVLFHSCSNSKIFFILRWSAAISAITILPTWHIVNSSFVLFNDKIHSFENIFDIQLYKSSSVFMIIIIALFICSSVVLLLHVCGNVAARRTMKRMLDLIEDDLQHLTLVPWIAVLRRDAIPTIDGAPMKQFLLHLKCRAWMTFNPTIWQEWPTSVLLYFKKGVVSREEIEAKLKHRYVWGTCIKLSLRVILVPLFILSSLPILNMFTPFSKELIALARGRRRFTIWNVFGILLFGITPLIMFFSMAMMFIFTIQILAYTFVGLLLNHNSIGRIAMVICVVTVFIVRSSLVLSSKYIQLLRTLIEKAQEVEQRYSFEAEESAVNNTDSDCISMFQSRILLDKVNESEIELQPLTYDGTSTPKTCLDNNNTLNTVVEIEIDESANNVTNQSQNQMDSSPSSNEEETPNTCSHLGNGSKTCPACQSLLWAVASDQGDEVNGPNDSLEPSARSASLVYLHRNIPHVSQHLFNKCVEAYLPLHVVVTKIVIRFLLLVVLLAFGLQTLKFVEGTNDLPEVGDYFLLGAIPGLMALIEAVLYSEAKRQADEEAKWQTLGLFLEEYRERLMDQVQNSKGT